MISYPYAFRLEVKKGPATRLLLMTTGVLLRRLQMGEGNLDGISHIFVDEVRFPLQPTAVVRLELI